MPNGRSENGVFVVLGGFAILVAILLAVRFVRPGRHPAPAIPAPLDEGARPSKTLDINVYMDGSGSIKHFLPPATAGSTQTNYVESLMQKCERTLLNAPGEGEWKGNQVRFWRFGAGEPKPIAANVGLTGMSHDMSLFSEKNTLIEMPVGHEDPNSGGEPRPELKIIMTDLYQSDGHLEHPADALAKKYLTNDTGAVGVLAVRSPFVGGIEDFPGMPRGKTLPATAADSMPFYVIFAGPAGDVRHAMDVLIGGVGLEDALKNGRAARFVFTRAPEPRAEEPMKFTGPHTTLDANYNKTHIPLVELKKGVLRVTWTDTREGISQQPREGEELNATVAAVGADKTLKEDADSQAAQRCGAGAFLCETIDRSRLSKGTTYVFRFDRVQTKAPDPLTPESPSLQSWNIEVQAAEALSLKKDPRFESVRGLAGRPGMTPDLSGFLAALQGQMFHDKVPVTSYYLYVQAN